MRALLLLLTIAACAVPTFDYIDGEDARRVIATHGYQILFVRALPVVGLTDCIDKKVWVQEGVWLEGVLMHEVIHVEQAESMGCGRFLAKYGTDPNALERPAYVNEYLAMGCDSYVTVKAAAARGLELTPEMCD